MQPRIEEKLQFTSPLLIVTTITSSNPCFTRLQQRAYLLTISRCQPQILRQTKNTEVCLAEVTGIDVQGQQVITADKSIPFDYLIVATGATSNYFGHEDWQQYAPGLKTLDDGMKLRDKILLAFEEAEKEPDTEKRQALLTFVLVGGGPTGVELAGALADLAHKSLSGNFRNIRPSSARIILVEGRIENHALFPYLSHS